MFKTIEEVLKCSKENDDIRLLYAWPIVSGNEKQVKIVEDVEEAGGRIIYTCQQAINFDELQALLFFIYQDEHWLGHHFNRFKGIRDKANSCYAPSEVFSLYIIQGLDTHQLTNVKKMLRKHLSIGKASVHTSDSTKETRALLELIRHEDWRSKLIQQFNIYSQSKNSFLISVARRIKYRLQVIFLHKDKKIK